MKDHEMNELIREVMNQEDQQILEQITQKGPMEKLVGSFRSRIKWLNGLMMVMMFLFFIGAIYCGYGYYISVTAKAAVGWASGFVVCLMIIGTLKLYQFMEIDRNIILRELKKTQYQLLNGDSKA